MVCDAIWRAERGLIDADLGGAAGGAPWAGSLRRLSDADCVSCQDPVGISVRFAKNERENVDDDELTTLR